MGHKARRIWYQVHAKANHLSLGPSRFCGGYYRIKGQLEAEEELNTWDLYIDRSSSKKGSGAGLILAEAREQKLEYTLRFKLPALKDEAKYKALI